MLMQRSLMTDKKVVIFAASRKDRDLLGNQLRAEGAIVLFFEKEAICFDNLDSIRPDIVVLRTDSEAIVWRFIFAAHTLKFAIRLLIISDVLKSQSFKARDKGYCVSQIEIQRVSGGGWGHIQQLFTFAKQNEKFKDAPVLIGESSTVKKIRSVIPNLQKAYDPILISGEPGTGKKLIAQLLGGPIRSSDCFFEFDCEHFSRDNHQNVLHSDIEQNANRKTVNILLGCIDKADKRLQSEILMFIDGNNVSQNRPDEMPGFRWIATSNSNLENLTRQGKFKKELFFRLNVIPIEIPPLRERKEDIGLLADFFVLQSRRLLNRSFMTLSPEMRQRLYLHDWPGNVEELRQLIHQIAVEGDEEIIMPKALIPNDGPFHENHLKQLFDAVVLPGVNEIKNELDNLNHFPLKAICDKFITKTEKKIMQKALAETNWNRKKAASLLNISYKSMLNKMKMYEIV
jgi:DNA-binding NtrC family response regulator